jgi:hypothetical protein
MTSDSTSVPRTVHSVKYVSQRAGLIATVIGSHCNYSNDSIRSYNMLRLQCLRIGIDNDGANHWMQFCSPDDVRPHLEIQAGIYYAAPDEMMAASFGKFHAGHSRSLSLVSDLLCEGVHKDEAVRL